MQVLEAKGLTVIQNGQPILHNLSFSINRGEQWAITGASGSGKTTLLKVLAGTQNFSGSLLINKTDFSAGKKIAFVAQQHHFKNLSNTSNFYYQQRFNSHDASDAITVEEDLRRVFAKSHATEDELLQAAELFDIVKLYNEPLIQLSNGENKRLQIVKALLLQPAFLLLDNPFIGLDAHSRQTLEEVLQQIAQKGIHIIMATSASHLPFFVTHVLNLAGNGAYSINAGTPMETHYENLAIKQQLDCREDLLQALTANKVNSTFDYAVRMKNVNVVYDKKILDNINWEVRNGERWSLSGPNGSGKSTLLSLVNADNPQAYANDIYLFDRKRGTGESIWDIKKKTGFVSPELHLYFDRGSNCTDVVASGLFD
ncbi:MAG TPA: ATP-binding cassette domain-containing protein, partial [Segetibacter sp.]